MEAPLDMPEPGHQVANDTAALSGQSRSIVGFGALDAVDSGDVTASIDRARENTTQGGVERAREKEPSAIIPEVRICDWKAFMNDFSPGQPKCAIEVLVAGPRLDQEISVEARERYFADAQGYDQEPPERIARSSDSQNWIHYIRIRSKPLLDLFSKVTGYSWGSAPRTFGHPFRAIVHYHDHFVEELKSSSENNTGEPALTPRPGDGQDDLRCYVEFVESSILPRIRIFRNPSPKTVVKARFTDLWHLLKPGDLIYVTLDTIRKATELQISRLGFEKETELSHGSMIKQSIWRLHSLHRFEGFDLRRSNGSSRADLYSQDVLDRLASQSEIIIAQCYYLDYNGDSYGAVSWDFEINSYEGEKYVTELEVYPLRFLPDSQKLLKESMQIGDLFTKYVDIRHLSYKGVSITTNPVGIPLSERVYGGQRPEPERIDGEVIVDFKEAFNARPIFSQKFSDYALSTGNNTIASSFELDCKFLSWKNPDRSELLSSRVETVFTSEDIGDIERDNFLQDHAYLRRTQKPRPTPTADDLALLPPRLYAFVLNLREFQAIDVRYIKELEWTKDAFSQLELPEKDKRDVKAAVQAHLRKRNIEQLLEKRGGTHIRHQDIIRLKGSGVIMMLHGEPGVGKTATAEAVAQLTKRPLMIVSCGTVLSQSDYSRAGDQMGNIFRYAELWGCILLLDEADVFLTSRSSANTAWENAAVSNFLQKVEYFNGIAFLTTNRTGKLDQAISSRIHLILHYRRPGTDRILKLFEKNLEKLREIEQQQSEVSDDQPLFIVEPDIMKFAEDHCRKHPKGKGAWNGRQIRNAFVMAAALARNEAMEIGDKKFQPQLRAHHFQRVETTVTAYNKLRAHVLGGDDARKARLNEERDDDYGNDEEGSDNDYSGSTSGKLKHSIPTFPVRDLRWPHLGRNMIRVFSLSIYRNINSNISEAKADL